MQNLKSHLFNPVDRGPTPILAGVHDEKPGLFVTSFFEEGRESSNIGKL